MSTELEPITDGEFDETAVHLARLPARVDQVGRAGALYVLEFDSGMVKVGRSATPQSRSRDHVRHVRRYTGGGLVRGWLSVAHSNVVDTEQALIRQGRGWATSVEGNEYLFGASFTKLVRFASSLTYRPVRPWPHRGDGEDEKDPWTSGLVRAVRQVCAMQTRHERQSAWPLPVLAVEGEEDEGLREALQVVADQQGVPLAEMASRSWYDLIQAIAEMRVQTYRAELQAGIYRTHAAILSAGRLDLLRPILPVCADPAGDAEQEDDQDAGSIERVDAWMAQCYADETARGEHDSACEWKLTPRHWACHCAKRRRIARGHGEWPGDLIFQAPTCPRCKEQVTDDGDAYLCIGCAAEWNFDGTKVGFLDDFEELA
jgi:hypothetical protein